VFLLLLLVPLLHQYEHKVENKGEKRVQKDSFKLMNNSVFGKTMDNIENRADVKSVTDREVARKLVAKPNFKHCTIFNENLTTINMKRRFYITISK